MRRNSELLPAPLAPVSTMDLPDSTVKLTPAKTRRPPRTQPSSVPLSSITAVPGAGPGMIHACFDAYAAAAHIAVSRRGVDAGFRPVSQPSLVQNFRSCGRTREKPL